MESKVKLLPFVRLAVHSLVAVVLLAIVALPLSADTITVKSDDSNFGASAGSNPYTDYACLTTGDTTDLTFMRVATLPTGSAVVVPDGAPAGTFLVQVPPQTPYYYGTPGSIDGHSGLVETTFVLPVGFNGASLWGKANVDDEGYVFLNGHLISSEINSVSSTIFGTIDASYFLTGVNTLVISDWNEWGGPSGVAYYADINYSSPTPEPSSLLMLGTGLVGLAGAIRRKLA